MGLFGLEHAVSDDGIPRIILNKALLFEFALFTDTGGWPLDATVRYYPSDSPDAAKELSVGSGRVVGSYHLLSLSGIKPDTKYTAEIRSGGLTVSVFESAQLSLMADPNNQDGVPLQGADPLVPYADATSGGDPASSSDATSSDSTTSPTP